MSDTDTESVVSSYSDVEVQKNAPREFSSVVGMDVFRAQRIIEAWGYYCVVREFPAIKKKVNNATERKRVILYLDKDGYVGTTPRVG
jgi:hypothetical protein